jgi:glutamate dehydrogenase/leucine dehydrogenase
MLSPYASGEIRMRPALDSGEVENLGRVMTAKFMTMGIPCGGAKGGIDCYPAKVDSRDVLKRYLIFDISEQAKISLREAAPQLVEERREQMLGPSQTRH